MLGSLNVRRTAMPHDAEYGATLFLMWPRADLGRTPVEFSLLSLDVIALLLVLVLLSGALLPERFISSPPRLVRLAHAYAAVLPLFGFVAVSLARVVSNAIYASSVRVHWDLTGYVARVEGPWIEAFQRTLANAGLSYSAAVVYAGGWMLGLLVAPLALALLGRHDAVGRLVTGWILAAWLATPLFLLLPVFEPWTLNSLYGYAGPQQYEIQFLSADDARGTLIGIAEHFRWATGACLPSLHVALPVLASRICFQQRVALLGWLLATLSILVGVSVVYLGRHWIIDVAAGVGYGLVIASVVARLRPERFLAAPLMAAVSCRNRS
jgi:membrane-associated phospholipid phosphatase